MLVGAAGTGLTVGLGVGGITILGLRVAIGVGTTFAGIGVSLPSETWLGITSG